MVSSSRHFGDVGGHRITMEVMHGGGRTLLSVIRLCGTEVIFNMTLNMCRSPHITIFYLLKDERRSELRV